MIIILCKTIRNMKKEDFERAKELIRAIREIDNFISSLDNGREHILRWENSFLGATFDIEPFMVDGIIDSMLSLKEKYECEFREL